jgi:hypothetical protein
LLPYFPTISSLKSSTSHQKFPFKIRQSFCIFYFPYSNQTDNFYIFSEKKEKKLQFHSFKLEIFYSTFQKLKKCIWNSYHIHSECNTYS